MPQSQVVYPRVGGGNAITPKAGEHGVGLSPRGRGKPAKGQTLPLVIGSIPAWAGETTVPFACISKNPVYPRVGGGNRPPDCRRPALAGLSPRGRGKRTAVARFCPFLRSIPAWAGETGPGKGNWNPDSVYPRVGGGNFLTFFPAAA